ncbi:MAG: hypothetical protein FJX75_21390 [Armatimonadetes bacterium]|nr:hypothetical protein [Armatimonadota bacterium]
MFTEESVCLRVDVQRAVQSLPRDQRDSILLVLVEGLTVRQAATLLGVSQETVDRHVRRGVRRLRYQLLPYS